MATQIFFTLKNYFSLVDERFLNEFLYRTMLKYGHFLCAFLCNSMLSIFWFIAQYIYRGKADHESQENGSKFDANHSQVVSKSSNDLDTDVATEKESSNFSFSLLSRESRESKDSTAETEDSAVLQSGFSASTLKYQFMAGKNVMGFMEEPETMSFTIQEVFVGSNDGLISKGQIVGHRVSQNEAEIQSYSEEFQEFDKNSNASNSDGSLDESGLCTSDDIEKSIMEEETPEEERPEYSLKTPFSEEILEDKEAENSVQKKIPTDEEMDDDISYELQLLPRNEFSSSELKPELENTCDGLFTGKYEDHSRIIEALTSDAKDDDTITPMITYKEKPEIVEKSLGEEVVISGNLCPISEANANEDTHEDIDDEYIELKPGSNEAHENSWSQKDESLFEVAHTGIMDEGSQGCEQESLVKESGISDSDDGDEYDILLEHQQLVKLMKMEMKNSKVGGLPTISEEEECETPKIAEDLKPLRIDEKLEYKDLMEEIHKFYKSYAEKMRKLDILNYQSLHAISFLQLKDTQIFMPSKKSLLSSIKPFSLPKFPLSKQRRIYADPTLKFITEMHRDLELVYVGQICLSWEILHWQYGKLKELLEHDPQAYHSYNQVAEEYQQFQVLVQRFLEDERFNGPRIHNYVKSRCFCRGLLQIPIIKDDYAKDKKEIDGDENDKSHAISISILAETIKESMQIFWEFLRADKEEANGVPKIFQKSLADPQAAPYTELLLNVRTCLEKKERKLKDIQRSGNCIVKKFQKNQAGQPCITLLISQVDLKLVSRVLNLSRLTTDHLVWCQKKLNNINISNRKICFEPAFLLFPC